MGSLDSNKPTRRALIVLSDGDDNQSRLTHDEASSYALQAEVLMFTISSEIHPNASRGDRELRDWAIVTGGKFFDGVDRKNAPQVFARIRDLLEGMYLVSYTPPCLDEHNPSN